MAKLHKVLVGCAVAIVLVCGIGGWSAWHYSDFGRAASELDQAVTDYRAAGMRNIGSLREFRSLEGADGSSEALPEPKTLVRSGVPKSLWMRIFLCRILQMWTRADKEIRAERDPMAVGLALDRMADGENKAGWSHIMCAILLPVFSHAGESAVRTEAQRRCTRGLIAVLRYKALHGRYPTTPAQAGIRESDPFDGKPLRLKVDPYSVRVYSVGPDKNDDGGIRQQELPKNADRSKGWDVVASYPAYRPTR